MKKTPRTTPLHSQRSSAIHDLTTRAYQPDLTTLNNETRTVDAVIATEDPAVVWDWRRMEPIHEVLLMDGAVLPRQLPLLDSHNRQSCDYLRGSTRGLRIENGQLVGTNHFSRSDAGQRAFQDVADGHLTDNSIGYRVDAYATIEPGKTAKIGGRSFQAPRNAALRVGTRWSPKENSLTPIGADEQAKMRSFNHQERHTMTEKQKQWIRAQGFDPETMSEEQQRALLGLYERQMTPEAAEALAETPAELATAQRSAASNPPNVAKIQDEARRAEQLRQRQIRELAGDDVPAETVDDCITNNRSVEECQGIFLNHIRSQRSNIGTPAIVGTTRAATSDQLAAAMLIRSHADPLEHGITEQTANEADRFRDLSLVDLCIRSLQLDQAAIPHTRDEIIRRAFSGHTLPYILGTVANKSALKGYQSTPNTWAQWCSVGSISNFQTQTKARLTDMGSLETVGSAGEVKHGTVSEEKEQYKIDTFAKRFSITRQDIINDDLGVFTKTPRQLGVRAQQKVGDVVYEHMMANGAMGDSAALFVSGHSNLNTSTALGSTGLTTALTAFRKQTDAAGKPINVMPKTLIIPPDLEVTARQLLESALFIATGTTDLVVPDKNIWKGMLDLAVEARLSNASFTNYSTTSWYLAADPGLVDTIEVGFLNGRSAPTVERFENDPAVLGITFRVYIDVGAKALDWRGLAKNTA